MTLKHIKFNEEELQAVAQIQRLYGCENFSQAVRLATRIAAQKRIDLPLPPLPKHAEARRPQSLLGLIQLPDELADAMDETIHQVQQQRDREVVLELMTLMDES